MKKISSKKKIIFGILILIAIFVLTFIFIWWSDSGPKIKEQIALGELASLESVKNNNPGPTITVKDGKLSPRSFMVEYPGEISLAVVSEDQSGYEFVFLDDAGIKTLNIEARTAKIITFKSPKPGRYEFEYRVFGASEFLGRGEMISADKPEKSVAEKLEEEPKVPGASMFIKAGAIQPASFTVAANSPLRIVLTSDDSQVHRVVFDHDEVLKAGEIWVNPGLNSVVYSEGLPIAEYRFHCTIPGHESEFGTMIVK